MAQEQIKSFPCNKKQRRKDDKKIEQVFNCKLNDDGDQVYSHECLLIFCFIFFAFIVTFLLFIGCHLVCKLRGAETSSLDAKVNKTQSNRMNRFDRECRTANVSDRRHSSDERNRKEAVYFVSCFLCSDQTRTNP